MERLNKTSNGSTRRGNWMSNIFLDYFDSLDKLYRDHKNSMCNDMLKYYKWIIKHGKHFKDTDRDSELEKQMIRKNYSHKEKQCYFNAQVLLTVSNDYEYYEGWYITENFSFPIEHAFIVDKGKVIDLTSNGRFQVIEYFGIKIPRIFVLSKILELKCSEPMLFRYWKDMEERTMKYKGRNIFDTFKEKLGKITEADMKVKDRVWIDWEDGTCTPIDIKNIGKRYKIKG